MNNNSKIITGVIALVVVLGLGYIAYLQPQSTQAPTIPNGETGQSTTNPFETNNGDINVDIDVNATSGAPMSAAVTYSGTSFSPSSVTIKKGGTVTFNNQSSGSMWVSSSQHPTHTDFDGTSASEHCAVGYAGAKPFDQCASGASFSFTFTKTGSFNYHNHLNPSALGNITVVN